MVIDYRNNPKASTGGFELIYKQIIPPAPAYLGLNLFLKGNQILPKGTAAKKEKSKESKLNANKPNFSVFHERPPPSAPPAMATPARPPTAPIPLPSRPFVVDFMDCVVRKNDAKVSRNRRPAKVKSLVAPKKPKKAESPPNSARPKSTGAGLRYLKILNENCDKKLKSHAYARRHASCSSRLASVQPPLQMQELINGDGANNPSLVCASARAATAISGEQKGGPKDFECVGNRCCVENLPPIASPAKSSARRQSVELSSGKLVSAKQLKPMTGVKGKHLSKKQISS